MSTFFFLEDYEIVKIELKNKHCMLILLKDVVISKKDKIFHIVHLANQHCRYEFIVQEGKKL
jgi:hypothetical protein